MTENKVETVEEVKVDSGDDEVLQTKKQSVAKQIEDILKENGFTLYPFIEVNPNAHVARVTLVEAPKENVKS